MNTYRGHERVLVSDRGRTAHLVPMSDRMEKTLCGEDLDAARMIRLTAEDDTKICSRCETSYEVNMGISQDEAEDG